jgi:8-oxo-dGTP pyrophosphatase MutT (NUDIX family)
MNLALEGRFDYKFRGPGPDEVKSPWRTCNEKLIYENPWICVSHREVINPAGGPGIYGVVSFKNRAIGIIPLDEWNNTWLVGQYRYTLGRYSWEIPEGGCPEDQEPLDAARRELREETGMEALDWFPLLELHTSNSVTDEYGMIFLARGLSFGCSEPEPTEDISVRKLPLEEAYQMVLRGEITDAMSMLGIFKAVIWVNSSGV